MTHRALFVVALTCFAAASGPVLRACPICFQIEDGPAASSVRAAVFVLVGVTTGVLMCCGMFVARFARRAARQALEPAPREGRDA